MKHSPRATWPTLRDRCVHFDPLQIPSRFFWLPVFLLLGVLGSTLLPAQQLPHSLQMTGLGLTYNPASFAGAKTARIHLSYQDRQIGPAHGLSQTAAVSIHSAPLGQHQNWAWGGQVFHDKVFIQHQTVLRTGPAVRLIDRSGGSTEVCWNMGLQLGLIFLNTAYDQADAVDLDDPLRLDNVQFRELDAGWGTLLRIRHIRWRMEAGMALQQIPGNWATRYQRGPQLHPHWFGHAQWLFRVAPDWETGLLAGGYRGLFRAGLIPARLAPAMNRPEALRGWWELAWKWECRPKGLGFLAGFRSGAHMLKWGINFRLLEDLSRQQRLQVAVNFEHPLDAMGIDGTTGEVGLLWAWR